MKKILPLFFLLATTYLNAQVTEAGVWSGTNNASAALVTNDADNGDFAADGAYKMVNATIPSNPNYSFDPGPTPATFDYDTYATRLNFTFGGTMETGVPINISAFTYNPASSFVSFRIQLYNKTENKQLSSTITITENSSATSHNTDLPIFLPTANDDGDVLELRFTRYDNGHKARMVHVDWVELNGTLITSTSPQGRNSTGPGTVNNYPTCRAKTPDLPLPTTVTNTQLTDIDLIIQRTYDLQGYADLTSTSSASYDWFGFSVTNGDLTNATANSDVTSLKYGTPIGKYAVLDNYARILNTASVSQSNKDDALAKSKILLWHLAKSMCSGATTTNPMIPRTANGLDTQGYGFPPKFISSLLVTAKLIQDDDLKDALMYFVGETIFGFEHFWNADYASKDDQTYQNSTHPVLGGTDKRGTISTDRMANHLPYIIGAVNLCTTDAKKVQYMNGVKRYIERFLIVTRSTTDGIKEDGTAFHHSTAYHNYLNAYKGVINAIYALRGTSFQIDLDSYRNFRKAVFAQHMQANNGRLLALSDSGRKPQNRYLASSKWDLEEMAIAGGTILPTAETTNGIDPLIGGIYKRLDPSGNPSGFNGFNTAAPFEEGFIQFNHANASVYRQNDWTARNKGFTDGTWGSEAYYNVNGGENRFGRYQSYGALEILYNNATTHAQIGYNVASWDWRYNPGATTIVQDWAKMYAEDQRVDEYQAHDFVGALAFDNKGHHILDKTYGTYGIFAMEFQERTNLGWTPLPNSGGESHDASFEFKKSNYYFEDPDFGSYILCLGSDIKNTNNKKTVTTLYQRLNNKGTSPKLNGVSATQASQTAPSSQNNWVISNYNTGFYMVDNSSDGNTRTITLEKINEKNPDYFQNTVTDAASYSSTTSEEYYRAYINHGTAPTNSGYEYIIRPGATTTNMNTINSELTGNINNAPYKVHSKTSALHAVEDKNNNIWAYTFFAAQSGLNYSNSDVTDADKPCLVMSQRINSNADIKLSVSNPDIKYGQKSKVIPNPVSIKVTVKGQWYLGAIYSNVTASTTPTETVLTFSLREGLPEEILLTPNVLSNTRIDLKEVKVYPVPAKNAITITNTGNTIITDYSITDMLGKTVQSKQILSNNKIDISNLKNGVYLLKMFDDNNDFGIKKIVIQK